jgi:NADH:ubiquinone oxidoreductase subunit C
MFPFFFSFFYLGGWDCKLYGVLVHHSFFLRMIFILRFHFNFKFQILSDIVAVDYVSHLYRFQLIYNLLSVSNMSRFFFKVFVFDTFVFPSVTSFYKSAFWLEREVFDFFGILFSDHPDLRRILNDYGFSGFPLRKDFPVSGFYEIRYDLSVRRIVQNRLCIPQEMRYFEFKNSWSNFNSF